MKTLMKAATLAVLVLAAACSSEKTKPEGADTSDTSGAASAPSTAPATSTMPAPVVAKPVPTAPAAALPTKHVLYFDFDKSELLPEAQATAEAWAAWLSANPTAKVRLEGHTDERGSREYNIALGERRGNAVLQALTARGVAERQLSVTSFGEERPVALGHDEAAWSQNRRVEIAQ